VLTEAQIDRYARHILLREVGGIGQERLLASTVAVEGLEAGGWLVAWLALAGVGRLLLDDAAAVSAADLAPLLSAADRGRRRDEALAAAIPAFNPDTAAAVGRGEAALRIRAGLPDGAADAGVIHWAARGDEAVVVPPGARLCPACAAALPAAPAAPAAASLAGSLAGAEALIHLLGRADGPRPVQHFRGGEPVRCDHG